MASGDEMINAHYISCPNSPKHKVHYTRMAAHIDLECGGRYRDPIRCPFLGDHDVYRADLALHLKTCPFRWPRNDTEETDLPEGKCIGRQRRRASRRSSPGVYPATLDRRSSSPRPKRSPPSLRCARPSSPRPLPFASNRTREIPVLPLNRSRRARSVSPINFRPPSDVEPDTNGDSEIIADNGFDKQSTTCNKGGFPKRRLFGSSEDLDAKASETKVESVEKDEDCKMEVGVVQKKPRLETEVSEKIQANE